MAFGKCPPPEEWTAFTLSSCYYGFRALGIVLESYKLFQLGLRVFICFLFSSAFCKTVP